MISFARRITHLNNNYSFSKAKKQSLDQLFSKSQKKVSIQENTGFLAKIFDRTKTCPSYILLKELFYFLQNSTIVKDQFPLIKSDTKFEENWMTLHLILLKERFKLEKKLSDAISRQDLQKFNYNAQVYYFVPYAQYLYPHTPALNFSTHFAEAFKKRFQIYEEELEDYEAQKAKKITSYESFAPLFRKLLFENHVSLEDKELMKFCKYYLSHRKYLSMLDWNTLISSRVKWGFEGDLKMIDQL